MLDPNNPACCDGNSGSLPGNAVSGSLPDDARLYLEHVENGASIRALARQHGCHASTIMRRIRKFEERRDDPLVDDALSPGRDRRARVPDNGDLMHVLRRLAESNAVMATVDGMEKAIVTRDDLRTATLSRQLAEHIALKGWIAQLPGGERIRRYVLVPAGREALRQMVQSSSDRCAANSPDQTEVTHAANGTPGPRIWDHRDLPDPESGEMQRMRVNIAESPLMLLAKRRLPNGDPFLTPGMIAAAERIREDFELAQIGPRVTQNWDKFMTAGAHSHTENGFSGGSANAHARVNRALQDLGPGLADVVLRVCCYLDGIERTERRMGWSARSGKVVLRLALMRLERHYLETYGSTAQMLG